MVESAPYVELAQEDTSLTELLGGAEHQGYWHFIPWMRSLYICLYTCSVT